MECIKCGEPDAGVALRHQDNIGEVAGSLCHDCYTELVAKSRRGRCVKCKKKAVVGSAPDLGDGDLSDISRGSMNVSLEKKLFCDEHFNDLAG